jgi:prohibitin 2
MNAFRQAFAQAASKIKTAGGAGGGSMPSAPQGLGTGAKMLMVLGLGSYGVYKSMVTIQPGHAALVYNRFGGLDEKALLTEGLNFVIPWFQRTIEYDVRTRPQPIDTQSGSKGKKSSYYP